MTKNKTVLKTLYGYEKPIVGARFATAPLLRKFLVDYNALHKKKKICVQNNSHAMHYYCHDKVNCSWSVRAKKIKASTKKDELGGDLKITQVYNVHSMDCTSKLGVRQYDASLQRTSWGSGGIGHHPKDVIGGGGSAKDDDGVDGDDDSDDDDDDDDDDDCEGKRERRAEMEAELKAEQAAQAAAAAAAVAAAAVATAAEQPPPTDDIDTLLLDVAAAEQQQQQPSHQEGGGEAEETHDDIPEETPIKNDEEDDNQEKDNNNNTSKPPPPQQQQQIVLTAQPDDVMKLLRAMQKNMRQFETRLTNQIQMIQTNMTHRWQYQDAVEYNRRYVRCGTDQLLCVPNYNGKIPSWFPKTLNELLFAKLTNYDALLRFYDISSDGLTPEQKRTALRRHIGLPY